MTRRLLAVVVVVGVLGTLAAAALAHTLVVARYPAPGDAVSKRLSRVSVTFRAQIREGTISVRGPSGAVSRSSGAADDDVRKVVARLRGGLRAGRYRASWRMTAADGHRQRGSWSFRVR